MSELPSDSSDFLEQADNTSAAALPRPSDQPATLEEPGGNAVILSAHAATTRELRASALAQLEEIARYQWYLGERLGRDPLLDRTKEDIALEWIALFAADFRRHWERTR